MSCARAEHHGRRSPRRWEGGFTLLEVMVALAILTVSLLVLIDVQSTAANMTVQSEKMMTATMLAEDKLVEVKLELEEKGFSTQEVEESGTFDAAYSADFPDYRWEYTVLPLDVTGAMSGLGSLISSTKEAEEDQAGSSTVGGAEDQMENMLGMFMADPGFLNKELGRFVRELRVRVFWKVGEDDDWVEIVTHVINPSGKEVDPNADQAEDQAQEAEMTQ